GNEDYGGNDCHHYSYIISYEYFNEKRVHCVCEMCCDVFNALQKLSITDFGLVPDKQLTSKEYDMGNALNAEDKKLVENTVDEQKRWREVIIEAMEVQQAKHYKHSLNLHHNENNNNESVDVQVCYPLEQARAQESWRLESFGCLFG
ncbi:hypothetical protein WUBG_02583, partial [Wuchereria bancrofti]